MEAQNQRGQQQTQQGGGQDGKIRIAIVGGGCAGLAAAWELSRQPKYEVHVYERSWRLGGKGASGRDAEGHIEEHGLHIWLGFYDNAFRMMRDCYAEVAERKWGPHREEPKDRLAHGSFEEAFVPEPHIGVAVENAAQEVEVWSGYMPPAKGLPGDKFDEKTNPFTLSNYLLRCLDLLKTLMLSVIGPADEGKPGKARPEQRSTLDESIELDFSFDPTRSPAVLVERAARLLRTGALTTAAGVLQAVTIFETWVKQQNYSPQVADTALKLIEAVAAQMRKQLRDLVAIDQKLRWKTEIIDIVIAIAVGLYRDRVLFETKGLDAINNIEYREWLLKHGATKTSVVDSRFLAGIYDFVFAYKAGDRKRPELAAGVALRSALRMFFTYRGSMFWLMRSGMGDAVFAPLYKILSSRPEEKDARGTRSPVHLHFLHSLSEVKFKFNQSERYVSELTFDTMESALVDDPGDKALDHFGCWPNHDGLLLPDEASRAPRQKVLKVGVDFDAVIFAMGLDDFVQVCGGKNRKSAFFTRMPPHWRALGKQRLTVATKAAQVWLRDDLEGLGWHRGSGMISALDMRFATWADMTHTLATEQAWRRAKEHGKGEEGTREEGRRYEEEEQEPVASDEARSVAYFVSVMSDEETQLSHDEIQAKVRDDLSWLLTYDMKPLWPRAYEGESTPWHLKIHDHVQANYRGSERYSLSLPGTIEQRISPLDPAVFNMSVCGDWTACGLDNGCVEAAVMSGMLAAHAITGADPALKSIIGYDHP